MPETRYPFRIIFVVEPQHVPINSIWQGLWRKTPHGIVLITMCISEQCHIFCRIYFLFDGTSQRHIGEVSTIDLKNFANEVNSMACSYQCAKIYVINLYELSPILASHRLDKSHISHLKISNRNK